MIAHAFPPEGAAGVYRPLRFIRHLPAYGWQGHVVASDQYYYERYDAALLDLVPHGTEVVRVRGRDPWQAFQAWRTRRTNKKRAEVSADAQPSIDREQRTPRRFFLSQMVLAAEAWSYHPDRAMLWIRPAVKATVEMCSRRKADVIWATAGPVSSFIVAQQASLCTRVPYVLDFRDAWTVTYNTFEARRPRWAVRRDRQNMYSLLKGAQAVTFRYETEAECYWRAYPRALDPSRIHIIPNGYEGTIDAFTPLKAPKCQILYTGTLSDYRYDTLLGALQLLNQSSPDFGRQVHFHFVGEHTETLRFEAALRGLGKIITVSNPMSHEDVSRLSREADVLLILGRPPTMKGYELFAAAKLFGYLKAGRPILGVVPADETRKILRDVGVHTVADAGSVPDIIAVLQQLIEAWSVGTLHTFVPNSAVCESYSAPRQTAELARALDGLPPPESFVPGQVDLPPSLTKDIGDSGWISNRPLVWDTEYI